MLSVFFFNCKSTSLEADKCILAGFAVSLVAGAFEGGPCQGSGQGADARAFKRLSLVCCVQAPGRTPAIAISEQAGIEDQMCRQLEKKERERDRQGKLGIKRQAGSKE